MSQSTPRNGKLKWIPVAQIVPNENNPRSRGHFKREELLSLRQSVAEHGVLQPILVQPYRDGPKDDRYLIIEGERRFSVARDLGMKEIPAVIGDKMDDHDQLVTMYHVHTQHRGWEMAEQLRTIKELLERNGTKSEEEMAQELGMTPATFKNRLRVLNMGDDVVSDIATDKIEYSSALRAGEVASSLQKRRPKVIEKLGGQGAVERKLLDKAKQRGKGISQELVEAKKDLADVESVPDSVVRNYIEKPDARLREVRREQESLAERRRTESLARELRRTAKDIEAFDVDLDAVPNLRELRAALGTLMDAAQSLEAKVVAAVLAEEA
jgi:ParB family transcriptional regulator, chromosome partitioning protein